MINYIYIHINTMWRRQRLNVDQLHSKLQSKVRVTEKKLGGETVYEIKIHLSSKVSYVHTEIDHYQSVGLE